MPTNPSPTFLDRKKLNSEERGAHMTRHKHSSIVSIGFVIDLGLSCRHLIFDAPNKVEAVLFIEVIFIDNSYRPLLGRLSPLGMKLPSLLSSEARPHSNGVVNLANLDG